MKNSIKKLFVCILFIALTIYNIFLSKGLIGPINGELKIKFYAFSESLFGLFNNTKQICSFVLLEIFSIFMIIYFLFSKKGFKEYKSDIFEVTPKIKIPSPAGEGQYGSQWFLSEKEIFQTYKYNILDYNNTLVKNLLEHGLDDFNDGLKKEEDKKLSKEIKKENNENDNEFISLFSDDTEDVFFDEENIEYENIFDDNDDEDNIYDFEEFYQSKEDFLNIDKITENNIIKKETEEERKERLKKIRENDDKKIFKSGGLILGVYKENNFEKILFNNSDTHSLILGSTRCGKSRGVVLPSIGNTALAGESILVADPKGELREYTQAFMEKLGYEVIVLDFKDANFSSKYNILQPIINAWNNNDIEKCILYTEELTNILVGKHEGGEKIWHDGEKACISGGILSVILNNKNNYKYQNMDNVYNFINRGSKAIGQNSCYLAEYCNRLIRQNPQIGNTIVNAFGPVINSAQNTRLSFVASALSTLRLFSQPSIWQITHKTDCGLFDIGERKTIVYFVLPDQNTMYYQIASIIVCQLYNELVNVADKNGRRLPVRVNFFLDEFGNFVKIPDFITKLTVGGGRGIRFNLFVQSLEQLAQVYGKEEKSIIKANCEIWEFLKADDDESRKEISEKLGEYTCLSNSISHSKQDNSSQDYNLSSSTNLIQRKLLKPEELGLIERPYLLITGASRPAITLAPDVSNLAFNTFYGMGDPQHNIDLSIIRSKYRKSNREEYKPEYWDPFTF